MGVKGNAAQGAMSRRKGVAFEREMSKVFGDWWGAPVRRTPLSGAYGPEWGLNGDLMFGVRDGKTCPIHVELKKHEAWRLEGMFDAWENVRKWWTQAASQSRGLQHIPWLVIARNRVSPIVLLEVEHLAQFVPGEEIRLYDKPHIVLSTPGQGSGRIRGFLLSDVLAWLPVDEVLRRGRDAPVEAPVRW